MTTELHGRVVKGLGGLYEILVPEAERQGEFKRFFCHAKGSLKRDEAKVLVGDIVTVSMDDSTPDDVKISSVEPRKNVLIRPPMSNLDAMYIVFSATKPAPAFVTLDKLIAIAVHSGIRVAVVITKSDLAAEESRIYADVYRKIGYPVFVTSSEDGIGTPDVRADLEEQIAGGKTAAFAGASGVGKSTLMNTLFPGMGLATSEISKKVERGKHTTRHVELFSVPGSDGFLADTPGFSLLDFEHFDFFEADDLPGLFPDFIPYYGKCHYADCTHCGEGPAECAVIRAAANGEIAQTRLDSYREIRQSLMRRKNY